MPTKPTELTAKPRIIVSTKDHQRLSDLATSAVSLFPDAAEALQVEMDRAEVVADGAVPADVVRMGSTVEFRSDAGQVRRVSLVYPPEADIAANRISILTPIGAALIGLAAGQSIRFLTYDGRELALSVLSVEQPADADSA